MAALPQDSSIHVFGDQDTVSSSPSAVAADAYSVTADVTTWTNDDDAELAAFILEAAWTTTPTVKGIITLYARLMNISGANDEPVPDASYQAHPLGTFLCDAVGASTTQYLTLTGGFAFLPNQYTSQVYEFYYHNGSDQSINASWVLKVTPVGLRPHP